MPISDYSALHGVNTNFKKFDHRELSTLRIACIKESYKIRTLKELNIGTLSKTQTNCSHKISSIYWHMQG